MLLTIIQDYFVRAKANLRRSQKSLELEFDWRIIGSTLRRGNLRECTYGLVELLSNESTFKNTLSHQIMLPQLQGSLKNRFPKLYRNIHSGDERSGSIPIGYMLWPFLLLDIHEFW